MKYRGHQNKSRFTGIYSRNNLPKIKDGEHPINFDEYKPIGTHWMIQFVKYFDSFRVE